MRIPNRIVGFLEMQDQKTPFELDKETFDLKLYFPTEDDANEHLFDGIKGFGLSIKEHKWIDKITFKGRTAEGYNVFFGTTDNPGSYNGYLTYIVDWYYVTDNDSELFDEIRIAGPEINYFYNPARTFQQKIKYQEENTSIIESMSVETVKSEDLNCGSYISEGITIDVYCSAYATMRMQSELPMDSKSYLKFVFSERIGVEELIKKARIIQSFIKYLCYRTNFTITDISTYVINNNGKKRNCGKLIFKEELKEEKDPRARERIIKADYLKENTAEILEAFDIGLMPYGHYCKSIEDTSHYPVSRIIMILAAFEREFSNVYGIDVRRSDDYKRVKDEVVQLVKAYAQNLNGKERQYAFNFSKRIANSDSSYGDNLEYALSDCKTIMEPFIIIKYEGSYEDIIKEISININELRNGIAHSRLDLEFEAKHLVNIKIVEEMIYVIRLKKIGVDNKDIQRCINELFKENIAI